MMLPGIPRASNPKTGVQIAFGGLNRNPGARDGAIYDMQNMVNDLYPVLSSRPGRWLTENAYSWWGTGFGEWGELMSIKEGAFYYGGVQKGTLPNAYFGERQFFVGMGNYVYIYPANYIYNIADDTFKPAAVTANVEGVTGLPVTFVDGTLNGEPAAANSLVVNSNYTIDFADFFKPGDAIHIEFGPEANRGAHIIREIDGRTLRFNENTFTTTTTESQVTISRKAPTFAYMCEKGNRLWGVSNEDNTIYACKLGDPFNWYVYDGLASDSYAVAVGSKGNFTGCISYLGYPMFFKENHIYKMYGSKPSNFELQDHMTLGVMAGNGQSLAIAGETLFYNSRKGIMAYTGSAPRLIQAPLGGNLGDEYFPVTAGSDGLKYYASTYKAGTHGIYVFDTQNSMWSKQSFAIEGGTGEGFVTGFALHNGLLYYMSDNALVWCISDKSPGNNAQSETESTGYPITSYVEFADFYHYTGSSNAGTNRKYVTRLLLRVECENAITVEIMYDSSGWQNAATIPAMTKNSRICSVPIKRCDHYRIRLESSGEWKLFSISEDYVTGSGSNATVTV